MPYSVEIQRDGGAWTLLGSNYSASPATASGLQAGSYKARVRLDDGAWTESNTVNVAAPTILAPTAVINATPQSGAAPLTVAFTATGSSDPNAGGNIQGYDWQFGDGTSSVANAPSKTYNTAGTYTATLRVMNNQNVYSQPVSRTITVTAAGGGGGTTVNFPNFASTTGLTLRNASTLSANAIQLSGEGNSAGQLIWNTPITLTPSTNLRVAAKFRQVPGGTAPPNEGICFGLFNLVAPATLANTVFDGNVDSMGFETPGYKSIRMGYNLRAADPGEIWVKPDAPGWLVTNGFPYTALDSYSGDVWMWFELDSDSLDLYISTTSTKPSTPTASALISGILTQLDGSPASLAAYLNNTVYLAIASRSAFTAQGDTDFFIDSLSITV